ncbi:MAG: ATP-dependent DNA helicase UvrD2 [Micropruina sp.]
MSDTEGVLSRLDPEQRRVATTFGAPVAVIAGAGTGKTTAITHRVAYGSLVGAYDPSAVLALTFTTRAAGELRGRLRGLGLARVQSRTFHSAALRQARFFWPTAYGAALPRVSDNSFGLVAETGARELKTRPEVGQIRDLLTEISWAKVTNVLPSDYAEIATAAGREVSSLSPDTIGRVYAHYERLKAERGVIDFDDVLLCTVALLSDQPDIATQIRRTYRHLVVDEYQDVSPAQQRLLDLWLGDSTDLCVVGDPAQTIHSFAGAQSSFLTNFGVRHRDAVVIELVRDYRSTPQVVGLANRLLLAARRTGGRGVQLIAQLADGPEPEFAEAQTEAQETAGVAQWLAARAADGVGYPDMAVLYRVNAQSAAVELALAHAGIPFTLRGAEGFFERREVRAALARLRAVQGGEPSGIVAAVRSVIAADGWTAQPPSGQGSAREQWESLSALLGLAQDFAANHPGAGLPEFNAELAERSRTEHAPPGAGVTLATFHSAKGLEWEAVALTGVQEGTLPFSLAQSPAQLAEELRLLYVGVTRARRFLRLSWSLTRGGAGQRRRPSRFLEGIGPTAEPARPVRGRRPKVKTAQTALCRICQRSISSGAELKLGRHLGCAPGYDEHTWAMLTEWRRQEADQAKIPAFCIVTDATLMAIAERRPDSSADLIGIPGVGKVKCDQYGEAVLAILRQERSEA